MMTFIKAFFAVAVPLLILDAVWLTTMSKGFYAKYLGSLMAPSPVWIAAVIFYVIYVVGVVFFVVNPSLSSGATVWTVLLRGALFGLVAYATYDLTNQATLAQWSTVVTVVDLIWGMFLTASASLIAFLILK